jgi:ATP-dependent helicase/nuclease subunit B
MSVVVGLGLGGPVFSARGGATRNGALLGEPVWGPKGLLRDLELRLGLAPIDESIGARLSRWTARIKSLEDEHAFYRQSFTVDELGTAAVLLEWRDGLVEAGWDGARIVGGLTRLDALAAIERHEPEGMPLGDADRLVRIERSLESLATSESRRLYDAVIFLEPPSLWPRRWRSIFDSLAVRGTSFSRFDFDLPGAPPRSDLALLQARLTGCRESTKGAVRGDGTVVLLRGNTPTDLAELTAALLARGRAAGATDVVVRCRDAESLESALFRHGLPAQGCSGESVWRPAMQLLPLAVELAFEPRDPYRLLELLTLSVGPFRGVLGARLARAVARQPGIGGKEWRLQKEEGARRLRDRHSRLERERGSSDLEAERLADAVVSERLKLLAAWLEAPGATRGGISRAELLGVVERVRVWLHGRLRGGEVDTYSVAYAQAVAFGAVVSNDTRDVFTQEDARQLVDRFARSEQGHDLSVDEAGRVAHLDHPTALLGSCDRVFLWSFVAGVERRPSRSPWNEEERAALSAAGVDLVDPSAALHAEAESWRRCVLAARERVVFVVPRAIKGTAAVPHPLWDEIRARLALDDTGVARITHDASRILDGTAKSRLVRVTTCTPVRLPEGRGEWIVPSDVLGASSSSSSETTTSVSALETIATCPLAWVLEYRAVLRSGAMSKVATGALLSGGLGHRLVEELFAEGAFDLAEDDFVGRVNSRFEELLRTEGATLLLPGASIERLQLTRQMRRAMRDLHRYLERIGCRIAAVEEVVTTDSAVGSLHGRLDLRLEGRNGNEDRRAILDLKWGASTYRAALADGRAVQLAVYSRAVARIYGCPAPPAAYFALASSQVLSTDAEMQPTRTIGGASLEETWGRAEATARAVLERIERGTIHVVGTKHSLPLLDALGVPDDHRGRHFEAAREAACSYCDYDALCGRKWQALS